MSEYTVIMKYILPISKNSKFIQLQAEELDETAEGYENMLSYILPVDTDITLEAGEVEISLVFYKVYLDEDGESHQKVRRTMPINLKITPNSAWGEIVPDTALEAIDQKIIKLEALTNALNELAEDITTEKADNIAMDGYDVYLTANGNKIGDTISIPNVEEQMLSGMPIVDMNAVEEI